MAYKVSEEQAIEVATLLILMAEAGGGAVTVEQLKFQYTRASWCDDIAAAVLDVRDRRIDSFIFNAINPRRYGSTASKLHLIDWDAELDRFSPGSRAGDFLQKLNSVLLSAGRSNPSASQLINIKRWVQNAETQKRL